MSAEWPTAELDPVRRLRVMAAGLNAVMYAEEHIDAPFAEVWAVVSDLEGELPNLVPLMRAFHFRTPAGEDRRSAVAYGPLGHRARFEVLLQPGWCLMQSTLVVGGMAAVPMGAGTRFAVLGGVRPRWLQGGLAGLRPVGDNRGRCMIDRARERASTASPPHGS